MKNVINFILGGMLGYLMVKEIAHEAQIAEQQRVANPDLSSTLDSSKSTSPNNHINGNHSLHIAN